jgi:uncharacterized protein (DUF362 family)
MISIIEDPKIKYPSADECFSPDEHYPEYRHAHISSQKNAVYKAVRDCFIQAGLDRENQGTEAWNPLRSFINSGSRVFLLCNFANQRRPDEPMEHFRSRCSHGSVIRALVDYILIATGPTGSVSVGNAPTQFGHWEAVLRDTEADVALKYYQSIGAPVQARDLRLYVTDATSLGAVKSVEKRVEADGVHVCLNEDSLFDELDKKQRNRYRVMNYDPRRTESFHYAGHHEYIINRHILEADVIFSAPKLKTHEKVGITSAIKGMVGTVGHKDSLPHHRYGPPEIGGDEYPAGGNPINRLASAFHEWVQKSQPDSAWGSMLRVSYKIFRRLIRRWSPVVDGAWWGNDTCWRMAVDLARIATYANAQGEMQASPCRRHIVMTDGIVGGEGDGPAFSTPVYSGTLAFSDNLVAADLANAALMRFDAEKIPLISRAARLDQYRIFDTPKDKLRATFNGHEYSLHELMNLDRYKYEPQDGWKSIL